MKKNSINGLMDLGYDINTGEKITKLHCDLYDKGYECGGKKEGEIILKIIDEEIKEGERKKKETKKEINPHMDGALIILNT